MLKEKTAGKRTPRGRSETKLCALTAGKRRVYDDAIILKFIILNLVLYSK